MTNRSQISIKFSVAKFHYRSSEMAMTEQNAEYESLVKFTTDISNLVQHNIVPVSARLLEKGLVTKDVHDSMLNTEGVSSQKNAARLLSCVLDRIKCSARCFQDFINVLREDSYFDDVVQKITAVHSKY